MNNLNILQKNINNLEQKTEYIDKDIVKTKNILRVGSGDFDIIGITRIRRMNECPPTTIVMAPGSNSDFDTSFNKMAAYLARLNIDVWGIDFRYSFVPDNINSYPYCLVTGCNFMKDWNTDLHVSDLDIVVKMAEMSSRTGKVFLSGWSQGGYFAYRYAMDHPNLKGIIPIDLVYNLDPIFTDVADTTRAEIATRRSAINSGIFYEDVLLLKYVAYQALVNPDGMSVIIPGLTNMQVLLFASTQTYQLGVNPIPNFIYNQGDLTGLKYTDINYAIQQGLKLNNFQSILTLTELREQWLIPTIPNITVPIFHVGAELGFGTYGLYTPNMIHNTNPDVNTYIVPDYGHADLVYSNTADIDVWQKIHVWMMQHSSI